MASIPVIGRSQRTALTAMACAALGVYAVVAMTTTAVSTALPHSHAQLGAFYLVHFLGFQIAAVVGGFLSDRLGRKGFMLGGCLGLSLGSLAMVGCGRFALGLAGMFLSGLGGGSLGPPALALTGLVYQNGRSRMLSIVEAWFCFGAFGWPIGVAGLLRAGHGWRMPYVLAAAAPLILAGVIALVRFPAYHDRNRRDTAKRLALLRHPVFVLSAAAIFCYGAAEVGTQGWLPRYIQERFQAGVGIENASVALFWAAMGVCRLGWVVALRRVTDRQMLIGSMVAAAVLHAGAVAVGEPYGALALFGGLGLAFGAVWPLLVAGVVKHLPQMAGTATGAIVAVSGIGAMLGPFALGQIGQTWSVALAVRLGWLLTAATLLFVTLIPYRKGGNPAPPPNV